MKKLLNLALVCATAVSATLIGLPASPASAAPSVSGLVFRSNQFDPGPDGGIRGTVACPPGYRLVGSDGGSVGGVLSALAPAAGFTAATIVVSIVQPPVDNLAFASLNITCAPADQFTDVTVSVLADFGAQPGNFRQGIVRCRPGYYAFGGGGYFTTADNTGMLAGLDNATNAPTADGNGWTFAGTAPPNGHKLVVITQCAPRTGRDFLVQFGNVSTDNPEVSSSVDCPSGYTAIAGGFYVSNPDGSVSTRASVERSLRSAHIAGISSWFVVGFAPPNTKMVALAQCLLN